jgi:epoxyqueuosine reductase
MSKSYAFLSTLKQVNKTAAELYKVRTDYVRFPQQMHMALQSKWNPEHEALEKKWIPNRRKYITEGREGFSIRDWAYYVGAATIFSVTNFPMHDPDQGGNSWSPVTFGRFTPESQWVGSSEEASLTVKGAAKFYGADQVGIANLDRRWVYSSWFDSKTKTSYPIKFSDEPGYEDICSPTKMPDGTRVIPKEMKYAIVLIHEMDYAGMKTGPTMTEMAATRMAYSRIAFTAVSLAEFIRSLGYNAIPSSNCTAINIPLAVDAGLGELGRNAKLITPWYGPRARISKVLTDLPLVPNRPITFGVKDFCLACGKCAEHCPVKAIPTGEPNYEPQGNYSNSGVCQWNLRHDKCRAYWTSSGTNCGLCISVCPFNKAPGWIHKIPRWSASNLPFLNRLWIKLDDVFGYGKVMSNDRFWMEKGNTKGKQ